jgi:hypothetical protein
MVLVRIVNELEDTWQKSPICYDDVRPVDFKNRREQLGRAQCNGGNGLLRECQVTDKEF